jgi:adenosylmethionine-8-amino-7-oxononanoate aminotransferase
MPGKTLLERDRSCVWHPYGRNSDYDFLLPIVRGEGALLITEDGREIIDAISSWWVNLHGHAHPALSEAVCNQSKVLSQAIFGSCTHTPAVELAEVLLSKLPINHACVFYSDNGSTAVEVAIKLALQYWRNVEQTRWRFLALKGGYHGDTFGAMSVSERGVFTNNFSKHLFTVDFLPFPDSSDAFVEQLDIELQREPVAALIVEPLVQGAAGMRMYPVAVLEKMIERCRLAGTLVIFDEVMTGFGRTGPLFACSHLTSGRPDLVCLSKGITGGVLPLGVTTMTKEIREVCLTEIVDRTFFHGHSFTGNALSCASALASFELLESAECQEARSMIAREHEFFMLEIQQRFANRNYEQLNMRRCGTIFALDVPGNGPTGYTNSLREYLLREFLKSDLLLRPLGNTVYILPPYCITRNQLIKIYQGIIRVLDNIL